MVTFTSLSALTAPSYQTGSLPVLLLLLQMGYLILREASCLDAFSTYLLRHSYPARTTGVITGTLEVSAPRSFHTRGEPTQISNACSG